MAGCGYFLRKNPLIHLDPVFELPSVSVIS